MGRLATIATCQLNNWALDFEGNAERIIESVRQAKRLGATLRVGPELEICGYGCLDHFLEQRTVDHAWEMLARIITSEECQDILLDIGMPVTHKQRRLNCRIICYNTRIYLIRPKLFLANEGNYREMRYFTAWQERTVEDYDLPDSISGLTGQMTVRIGDVVIKTHDTVVAPETCEELFTPNGPHIRQSLDGVEIFTNSSGSHHNLRKLNLRVDLILEATKKCGGVYLYSNQRGCDGDRLYYDGCALIVINGNIKAQGQQFSLDDVEVCSATVNLDEIGPFRSAPSRGEQSMQTSPYERVHVPTRLSKPTTVIDPTTSPSPTLELRCHLPAEEVSLGAGCYLWDFLRRSRQAGFFLPLSGGVDSCATAVIVFSMCRLVCQAIEAGNLQVLADARRICGEQAASNWRPASPRDLCNRIFVTCYMGSENSSAETRQRAKALATDIGAYHFDLNIDTVVAAFHTMFTAVTRFRPRFKVHGGTPAENLALQNIQARVRMVTAYMFAQLLPTVRGRQGGSLLVLGSANVDESLSGYLTKYDCSSADINPIGSISKTDLKRFIGWARDSFALPILDRFLDAVPTAELEPITADYVQSDEADMGLTYAELSRLGTLRKVDRLGPVGMWERLVREWGPAMSPRQVYDKVRRFHERHNANRHKMTTLTPAVHFENYSPDDNRHDLRPFLYPPLTWQWKKIEEALAKYESSSDTKEIKQD